MPVPHITLLTKPGCHLCDDARATLESVLDEVEFAGARDYDELSILDDPSLADEYSEEIPVVLIDNRVHTIWRVEPERLRTALRAATPGAATPGAATPGAATPGAAAPTSPGAPA